MTSDEYDAEFFEKLSEELEATHLELLKNLPQDSNDPKVRAQLLSAAEGAQLSDPGQVARVREHSLWLIEHRPSASLHSHPAIRQRLDPEGHSAAGSLWLAHVSRAPTNLAILKNAAAFFGPTDFTQSKALLERGETLDPKDFEWPFDLGVLLSMEARGRPEWDRSYSEGALAAYQRALEKSDNRHSRASCLEMLAETALLLHELELAARYANELLNPSPDSTDSPRGDSVYTGHSVLGMVAIHRGNLDEACRELLEAGKTTGSPVLETFGPELDLANALLQRGRRDVVVEFLKRCATFWEPEGVGRWIDHIIAGETPTLDRREWA